MSARTQPGTYIAPARFALFQNAALFVGIVCGIGSVIGLFLDRGAFFRAYLLGFAYWWNLSVGCLALLMLYFLVGGMWGFTMRRPLEAASLNLLYIAVLWIPLIFGTSTLYEWMNPDTVKNSSELLHKASYLNLHMWIERGVLYFALWGLLAVVINRWSSKQDQQPYDFDWRFQRISGSGLVIYLLTITFASVDWVMSLEPTWSSTIYGLLFLANQALLATALMALMGWLLYDYEPLRGLIKHYHFQDWGKLMLTFTMIFGYFQFSQLLVIWSGNMPEEISWYYNRDHGGWSGVSLAVALLQFCIPFALLLSRSRKRSPKGMLLLAVWMFVIQYVVTWWMHRPSTPEGRALINFSWQDIVVWAAMGGFWVALFFWRLRQRPLLVVNDPKMEVLLTEHEHEH